MPLHERNVEIQFSGHEVISALQEIELAVVSLHKIGAYYAVCPQSEKTNYAAETARFIDEWKITTRLARARSILSARFDSSLGGDDMDDLERAMETVDYWRGPLSHPQPE